jgi:hypothetical protein
MHHLMNTRLYFCICIPLQFSIQVFSKVPNDKYSTGSFVLIKYITPKTYYYIALFKIYELVERAFLRTLIVWCPCYKNNMDTRIINNLNMIINN